MARADPSIGPFKIAGELPTLPGYDPGRSLTRPGGPFVMLGHVTVGLRDAPDAGQAEHAFAWVNRYAVEAYQADLDLGAWFRARIRSHLRPRHRRHRLGRGPRSFLPRRAVALRSTARSALDALVQARLAAGHGSLPCDR